MNLQPLNLGGMGLQGMACGGADSPFHLAMTAFRGLKRLFALLLQCLLHTNV